MSNKINEKLGLRPPTRTRKATHGSSIVSAAQCPKCGCRYVVENTIRGVRKRMCAACSHSWEPPPEENEL